MRPAHALALSLAACCLALPAGAAPRSEPACSPDGRKIAPGACLEIDARIADDDLTLEANDALPPERLRDYCPNLVIVRRDGARTRVELAKSSFLYDTSDCCPGTKVALAADARRGRFTVSGLGRDCFGGTAHFEVEETYRLDRSGKAVLIRRSARTPPAPQP